MSRIRVCKTCRFFDKEKSECHKSQPLYIDKERSLWPFIFNDEECWCGEWRLSHDFIEDKLQLIAMDFNAKILDQATMIMPPTIDKSFSISLSGAKVLIRGSFYSAEKKEWTELTSR